MSKVLLTRHQFVNHAYYRAGENEVTDEVAGVLKKRGVLGELPKAPAPAKKKAASTKVPTPVGNTKPEEKTEVKN